MIAKIDGCTIDIYKCFTTIDKAIEFLSTLYTSHQAEVLKNYHDEDDDELVLVIRYHNDVDEFTEDYRFIEVEPIA